MELIKILFIFIAGSILIILIIFIISLINKSENNNELEIYTSKNIYYINGLVVTNERDNITLTFNSQEELKEYISDIIALENK